MFKWKDDVIYDELWDIIAGGTIVAGTGAVINDVFGFYLYDGVIGDEITFVHACRQVEVDKETGTGEDIEAGEAVYYNVATGLATSAPGGAIGTNYYFIGIAKKDADENEGTVLIKFWGDEYNHADRAA